jgi:hypothetical protein
MERDASKKQPIKGKVDMRLMSSMFGLGPSMEVLMDVAIGITGEIEVS